MMFITENKFKTDLVKLLYNLIKLSYDPRPGWRHRFVHSQKHVPGRLGRPQGVGSVPAGWMDCHDLQKCRLPGIEQFLVLYIYVIVNRYFFQISSIVGIIPESFL